MGFHGNCSGHGTCMDSAVNQWWSGSSGFPDMWAWEEPSKHVVRRDVELVGDPPLGHCDFEFYGVPTLVESRHVWLLPKKSASFNRMASQSIL